MSEPKSKFCNDLGENDEITVTVGESRRITGTIKNMNRWTECGPKTEPRRTKAENCSSVVPRFRGT